MQTHPQGAGSILEAFLNQRVSAYRFHESLNLGIIQKQLFQAVGEINGVASKLSTV